MVKAILKNHRQSARKVRLVVDAIRGKRVLVAIENLSFIPKKASLPIQKLLKSAVANAVNNFGLNPTELFIKTMTVDEGYTLKRMRPRARGSAFPINKRTCTVTVFLDVKNSSNKSDSKEEVKEVEKVEEKKAVSKPKVAKKVVAKTKKAVNKK
jgi:large subunit ribosomal protein L22